MTRNRNPSLHRARELRNNPTDTEYKLWGCLRARQLGGVKFRRQATIGRYIVDSVSYEERLIVELDGEQHAEQREYDDKRTEWLQSQGFRVVRFWNAEVLEDLEAVLAVIARELRLPF